MSKPRVTIYTDGSLRPKMKRGGWAAMIVCGPYWQVIADEQDNTTVPRMELTSVIMAMYKLTEPCNVTIVSDSMYVINIINKWIHSWVYNNFMTQKGTPVANQDLLCHLSDLMLYHDVTGVWVKSHTNSKDLNSLGNAVVDEFAQILTR